MKYTFTDLKAPDESSIPSKFKLCDWGGMWEF